MQADIADNLVDKYLKGNASIDEIGQLEKWYDSFDSQPDLYVPGSFELNQAVAKGFLALKVELGIG